VLAVDFIDLDLLCNRTVAIGENNLTSRRIEASAQITSQVEDRSEQGRRRRNRTDRDDSDRDLRVTCDYPKGDDGECHPHCDDPTLTGFHGALLSSLVLSFGFSESRHSVMHLQSRSADGAWRSHVSGWKSFPEN